MHTKILFFTLFFTSTLSVFPQYPQDYFRSPLDIPLILSGTFAELRANHFHSGLDIKTQQKKGLNVYASAAGFVSRIKITHFGYGKALYITHPNGYTTVYGHLKKFSPTIEAYIKKRQYEEESYEIELFPTATDLLVEKGEIVAFSGNSGSSSGPHLHYEIRDNKERPINPMLFGLDIKDSRKPTISEVFVYPADDFSHVNNSNEIQKLKLTKQQNGDYVVEDINACGVIGFAIIANDKQDLANNSNGLYNIETFCNGNTNFEIDFKRFSFNETKHLNRLIDYGYYKTNKKRIQKLFVETNNPLSLYKNVENNGYLVIEDNTTTVYKVKLEDFKGNSTWLTINIKGHDLPQENIKEREQFTSPYYVQANKPTLFKQNNVTVAISKNTFYDNFFVDFKVSKDTVVLHQDIYPAKKSFYINYDISNYKIPYNNKLYIAELVGYNKYPLYINTKKKGDTLVAKTKYLGTYALTLDTIAPKITPVNFKNQKWVSKLSTLKVKIEDNSSGISNFRATINGEWILMEYDYKTKLLTYNFNDKAIRETKQSLKIIVIDNVGNSSTFEALLYRK